MKRQAHCWRPEDPAQLRGADSPALMAQGLTGDRWVQGGDDAAPFNPEESRPWRSESPPLGDEEGSRGAPWRRLHRLQDVKGNKTWTQPPTSSECTTLHHRETSEKPWVMVKVQGDRAQTRSGPRPARACAESGSALSSTLGDHACMPALGVTMHRSKDGLSGPGGGKPVSFWCSPRSPGQGALASWGG